MHIVIDESIPGVESTFALHGPVSRISGRDVAPAELLDADVLIVRSVTRVGRRLLQDSRVRFVGTTTIGTDHLDLDWLQDRGIRWVSAPGCNADAAAQYTLAMMILAGRRLGFDLRDRRIGIVGHGNVGRRLHRLLDALSVRHLAICDPPLAAAGQRDLCTMSDIARCDVVSLHVPLTVSGPWPTRHLVNAAFLDSLPERAMIVNTARGAVIHAEHLAAWLRGGGFAALDVWPDEPDIPAGLVHSATVATPHVAGYSLDGKLRGTLQVYSQFRAWLGLGNHGPDLIDALPLARLPRSATGSAADAVLSACPVERDDAALRAAAPTGGTLLAAGFDALRTHYPGRRDFAGWRLPHALQPAIQARLEGLGFH